MSFRSPALLAVLAVLWTVAPPAQAQAPPTGAVRSQTLHLAPGPNLVALDVVPDDASLSALLGPVLSGVLAVNDRDGHIFAPSVSATDLSAWSWRDAYLVHAADSLTITVDGAALAPEAALPLEAGWNWVPYFLRDARPVEDALATILGRVTRVEDAGGHVYPQSDGWPLLTHLRPGHGYRIHLAEADTLVYASGVVPPPPAADRTAGTLAEALALPGLAPGQTVEVLGYHTPGDGGGGLFAVSGGNERPDGGVVFVPESALSGPLTHVQNGPNNPLFEFGPTLPAGVYAPHRDWTMVFAPNSGAGPFTINAWRHLSGHAYASQRHLTPGYDGDGIAIVPFRLRGVYGNGTWTLTYRATTGPLRLVRQGVGEVLDVRWFGARTEAEAASPDDVAIGSDFDVQVALTWAVNLAQRRNDPAFGGTPGTVTTLHVPAGTWRFAGPVELTDGLTLAGDGGTAVVDATTTIEGAPGVPEADVSAQLAAAGYAPGADHPWAGYRTAPGGAPVPEVPGSISRWSHQGGVLTLHYRPTRVVAAPTRLRLFDGVVALGVRMSADAGHVDALPGDVNFYVGKYQTSVTASSSPRANGATPTIHTGDGPDVMAVGVRDLVLDGNHEANRELWTEGRFGYNGSNAPVEFENWMRNSPSWGGICVSDHGGKLIPVGQTITLRGVAVVGFGSNGLLGHPHNVWDAEAVLIGNSLWNHTLYGANGRYRDLTVTGFAWTHLTPTALDVENFVYEGGAPAPYRGGNLLGQRGFDVFSNDDGPANGGGGLLPTGLRGGFRANGYFLEGRNAPGMDQLGSGAGPETRIEGAVVLRSGNNRGVYGENHNGYYKGLWSGHRFDRVLSTRGPSNGNAGLAARGPFQGLVSTEHVELQLDADDGSTGLYSSPITLVVGWSNAARGPLAGTWPDGTPAAGTRPWDRRLVQVVDGLHSRASTTSGLGFTNRLNRGPSAYNGPDSPLFQPDPLAPSFDARSGGARLFVLDVHARNVTNTVLQGPSGDLSGAERYVEFFVRHSSFQLQDYGVQYTGLLRQLAYFDDVTFYGAPTDRQPGRAYTSEDVQTFTASGGETTVDLPTDLFYKPVAAWTVGDRSFTGGTTAFSGPAAARVAGYAWVRRPSGSTPGTTAYWDDWRAPILRVTFTEPLAAGETLTATMAVRPWPAASPDGLPVVVPE